VANEKKPTTVRQDLGDRLVEANLVTPEQLTAARLQQRQKGGRLGDILTRQGAVRPDELAVVQSIYLNLPLIDLKRHQVQPEALALIPEEMARKHTMIPLDIINDSLMVVMADPEDIRTLEDIKAQVKMRVEAALGVRPDIERAINLNYRSADAIEKQVSQFAIEPEAKMSIAAEITATTPVAETLDLLLTQAVKDRASDVHIEPQEARLRIRYRIDGILHDAFSFPLSIHQALVSRVKILAGMDIAEQRRPQDGQFAVKVDGNEADIRAATMETPNGERVTLRILDKSLSFFTLAELGMQPATLAKYQAMLRSPLGMLLAGGPTGSGKTTTLYAAINELNRYERNIMTIEDPIEYSFIDLNQTQVNTKAGITFASGLRAIMRHDPDVILVGEIRDKDTVTTAVQAALTGHLVLSSIHANDAVGVLYRLLDLGVVPASISSTLIGTVSQRMVRKICANCREAYQPTPEELAFIGGSGEEIKEFHQGTGCNLCAGTGYRGRTGIFELLAMNEAVTRLVRDHGNASEIKAQAVADGMMTMKQDGILKVKEGITTVGEVMRSVFTISP